MSSTNTRRKVQIRDRRTRIVLAEGQRGWDITPFEGNFYLRSCCVRKDLFRPNYIPGLCPYKGLYVWVDLVIPGQESIKNLAWLYWLPNPLFPFIWYRIAVPGQHPDLLIEETVYETRAQDEQKQRVS
jgi:uncharacterized protein (DUF427 family)